MTERKPRTKPAEQRRADLLQAAEQAFLENGFEGTTVEDLTRGAGVAKGAFYLHFKTKTDVAVALRDRFVERLRAQIREAVDAEPSGAWNRKLRAWATACATGYLDTSAVHRLVFSAAPSPPEGLTRNGLIDDLARLLREGAKAGAWTPGDAGLTAILLFNAVHGAIALPALQVDGADRKAFLEALSLHVLHAVSAVDDV